MARTTLRTFEHKVGTHGTLQIGTHTSGHSLLYFSPDGIANQPFPESSKTIHTLLTDHSKRTSTSVCASFDRASFLGQLRNTVDGAYSDCMLAGFDLRSVFIRGYPKEDTSGRSRVDYHNLVLEVVDRVQELCRDFEMEYSQQ